MHAPARVQAEVAWIPDKPCNFACDVVHTGIAQVDGFCAAGHRSGLRAAKRGQYLDTKIPEQPLIRTRFRVLSSGSRV